MTLEAVYSPEVPSVTEEYSAEDLVANFQAARRALACATQRASDADIAYRVHQEAALRAHENKDAAFAAYLDAKEKLHVLDDETRARLAHELQARAHFYDELCQES